jgi:glutamate N-acetyltransferase/amino-acid N-acetyltransferase
VSIVTPKGFVASGLAAGIKASGALDLALLATEDGSAVSTAATFTTNRAAAAPVQVSREHLRVAGGRAAAVLVSSGNANAATGERGRADAERMCELVSVGLGLGLRSEHVLVCSTGLIGIPLPMPVIESFLPELVSIRSTSEQAGRAAATGILTTDAGPKEVLVEGAGFCVAGMAKGAGMLAPDMATMLAFLSTDARVEPSPLTDLLQSAVRDSFNAMTVDGCTSTNDTVVLMASGRAGPADPKVVAQAVGEACSALVDRMLADAEGASRVMQVRVTGGESESDAHRAARKVADSLLVKCSLNGADPYWGRVASELGSAGVAFELDRLAISYGGVTVCRNGVASDHDTDALARHLSGRLVDIHCELGLGDANAVVLGVDLGYGYIDENRTTS